jgi:hypothetical protein
MSDGVELVQIGVAGARIVRVTAERIEYVDSAGRERAVDLRECVRVWCERHGTSEWDSRCVGDRGALDEPPWVRFVSDRATVFELASYEALYEELLGPLHAVGWHTFDSN